MLGQDIASSITVITLIQILVLIKRKSSEFNCYVFHYLSRVHVH